MLLTRAHSHNDYWRARPLWDALECGFCSVEVDIFLHDDALKVGHEWRELRAERTLQSLYLEPLRHRARQYRGAIYPDAPSFQLLIDLKTDWQATYPALRKVLEQYADLITHYEGSRVHRRAVEVVLSGNRPPVSVLKRERIRFASYDGRLSEIEAGYSPALMPLVSDNWLAHFRWNGRGDCPQIEVDQLKRIVQQVHSKGYKLRFWNTADLPAVWQLLWHSEVDFIGTDVPTLLRDFMRSQIRV